MVLAGMLVMFDPSPRKNTPVTSPVAVTSPKIVVVVVAICVYRRTFLYLSMTTMMKCARAYNLRVRDVYVCIVYNIYIKPTVTTNKRIQRQSPHRFDNQRTTHRFRITQMQQHQIALQLDTLIPNKKTSIDIGPCRLHDVRDLSSGSGIVDFHGATVVNVSGIITDPDLLLLTCPITTTVGAAVVPLITYATTLDTVYYMTATILAKNVASQDHYATFIKCVFKNVGGVIAIHVLETKQDNVAAVPTTLDVIFIAVGPSIVLQVTGEAGTTLHWKARLDLVKNL